MKAEPGYDKGGDAKQRYSFFFPLTIHRASNFALFLREYGRVPISLSRIRSLYRININIAEALVLVASKLESPFTVSNDCIFFNDCNIVIQ